MKIKVVATPHGLVPLYDEDYEEKRKLKLGECYEGDFRLIRNPQFHKKAFALLNTAWMLLPGTTQDGFRSVDGFRAYVTVAAGFYDLYFNPRLQAFTEVPKSWAFDAMDEAEFTQMYDRIKDVIWGILSKKKVVSEEVFERYLQNY